MKKLINYEALSKEEKQGIANANALANKAVIEENERIELAAKADNPKVKDSELTELKPVPSDEEYFEARCRDLAMKYFNQMNERKFQEQVEALRAKQ